MVATTRSSFRVVVIGGGISGLSTAWYLEKQAIAHSLALDYTVVERSNRWGGKVFTETVDDFIVEGGPDSFLTQKPWALQLARELGLNDQLLGTNDAQRTVYVVNKGRPVPLPDGVLLIVPTRFLPFALSPLISPLGKLRMGMDLFIPPRKDDGDETLAEFIRRRLGDEALDKIAEPLMSGIYNADAEQQSVMATFPRFRAIEAKYGSLTRGMIAASRARKKAATSGPKTSMFVSLQSGTNALIDALAAQLCGDLRLNTDVEAIIPQSNGSYHVQLVDGAMIEADAVVMTTPAYAAADLVGDFAPSVAEQLAGIRYVSTGTLSLAFNTADIPRPLNGFGLVVPSSEKRPLNAITVSSTKFDHRAPDGRVLMRAFFGGSRSPASMQLDDVALLQMVRGQLRELLGIEAAPLFHRIYRWWNANPQYDIGHLDRVNAIEAALPDGLFVTGSACRGVGMPDCVHQAQQTAEAVIQGMGVPV